MADLNPVAAWRRMLAAPNDSRGKTIAMAFVVATICAVMVTGATVVLRPIQTANRAAEQNARLEQLIATIPGMTELLAQSPDGALSTVVIEIPQGRAHPEVTPEGLDSALQDNSNWTGLTPAQDTAGIGSRPDLTQIYLLRENDRVSLVILPMVGAGYNGPIQAMLALRGDMATIAGLAITQQGETPGLGARIEEPAWLSQFPGTRAVASDGTLRFAVARGPASNEYEVDGITGATRTSNAITQMVRFWLGPDGYGPLMAAIQRGDF
ncbi:FMN-binding protein [Paracoccus sp. (in: a-proteobacteria)]|uniref:FMN-binding protein n=1 Tax=Paracoccus sp. TaxID=267 RepID=UPI0026DF7BB0|nr:FMN-binding protein [Paracoccus sp. (in: a-proteobacteria)]MDO5647088.1 FMN-binding protein [Paracoccus sp. (in: a-proteobacteria)]